MKKVPLLLSVSAAAFILAGCSPTEFINNLDSDQLSEWVFSVSEVELDPVLDGQAIKENLPIQLSDLSVDGSSLGCEIAHLAIRDRNTDTTRQTDQVTCEVELEGEGISAQYLCTLNYTYTSNGGWGLRSWSIDQDSLDLDIGEGALTNYLNDVSAANLESQFGEGSVAYQTSTWDKDQQICSAVYTINAADNYLLTQGYVTLSAALSMDIENGLSFTWDITEDTSAVLHSVDISSTTWYVSGTVDTTAVQLALSVSDVDIERQTVTLSAYSGVMEEYDDEYYTRYTNSRTVDYTIERDGTITFSFPISDHTWSGCFSANDQWVRMDGSYVGSMTLISKEVTETSDLRDLLQEDAGSSAAVGLDYTSKTGGYTYTASDGTVVYEMQVRYPEFSGSGASHVNTKIQTAVSAFLARPQVATNQSELDALATDAAAGDVELPYTDQLDVTIAYNQNGYISLLYTYQQRLTNGKLTYSYDSFTYSLTDSDLIEDEDVYTGSSRQLGALLNAYAGTTLRSDATVMSFVKTWTMSRDGITFYVLTDESSGACTAVTVPYSEDFIVMDPTAVDDESEDDAEED